MDRGPGSTVTGRTVTTRGEGLRIRAVGRYQGTVGVMTGCTCIMDLGITCIGQRRRIRVASCTIRRSYLHQGRMIRRYRCMGGLPTVIMTGPAVAASGEGLTHCRALETAVGTAVAVGAVSNVRRCID